MAGWHRCLPKSKWWGRGGIKATLMRYKDTSARMLATGTGSGSGFKMGKRAFCEALRDGLMMGDKLKQSDVDDKDGFIHSKPWTTEDPHSKEADGSPKEPIIDVDMFCRDFLDVYFEDERCLYDVLLVQNRWHDLRSAFKACSYTLVQDPEIENIETEIKRLQADESMSSEDKERQLAEKEIQRSRLVEEAKKDKDIDQNAVISKNEFGAALQKLVEKGTLTDRERAVIIRVCERDRRFVQQGRYIGYTYHARTHACMHAPSTQTHKHSQGRAGTLATSTTSRTSFSTT